LYKKLIPGSYPIRTTDDMILFSIGKRSFGISKTRFMNSPEIFINCIFELSKKDKLYPLQNSVGNRFFFGKYSEFDIRINFNNLEIKKRI